MKGIKMNMVKVNTDSKQHSKYSPSASNRWLNCFSSATLEFDLPEETNQYAEQGNKLHEAWETGNYNTLSTDEQLILERADAYVSQSISNFTACDIFNEVKLRLTGSNYKTLLFGTADKVAINFKERKAHLFDLKTGFTPVDDASMNSQLAIYATALSQLYNLSSVVVHIVQPTIGNYSSYEVTGFDTILKNVETAISIGEAETLSLTAGSHCKYCKAKNMCTAYQHKYSVAKIESNLALSAMNNEYLSSLMDVAVVVESRAKEIRAEMHKRLGVTPQVGNYTLSKPSKTSKLTNPDAVYSALSQIISPNEFVSCTNITKGKLEKLYIDKVYSTAVALGNKITKISIKKEFASLLSPFIEFGTKEGSIVRV